MPTPEEIAAQKAVEEKAATDKSAAEKAAADKAAAEKAAAEKAAKAGEGEGSDGDVDLSSEAGGDKAGAKGPEAGAAGKGPELKLEIPEDLKESVPSDWVQKTLKAAKELPKEDRVTQK